MTVPSWRRDFPLLGDRGDLVYLDNAATTQKPQAVLDSLERYYRCMNANVHRGAHRLSDEATAAFEQARETLARRINAPSSKTVLWTRGTTEAINLVAAAYGPLAVGDGDRILVTEMEHHSNIVPWHGPCAFCHPANSTATTSTPSSTSNRESSRSAMSRTRSAR